MRIGAENRNQIIALLALAVVVAFLLPRFFSGPAPVPAAASGTAAPGSALRRSSTAARTGRKAPPRKPWLISSSLDPSLRYDLLKQGENQEYEGGKRNIFDSHPVVEIPKPVDNGSKPAPQPAPPVVQGPPPIPLKFYGFATQAGQAKRIFLSSGDDVFVGTEGQVINRRYRIVKVNSASVDIEDILNNNKQTIPLTPPS